MPNGGHIVPDMDGGHYANTGDPVYAHSNSAEETEQENTVPPKMMLADMYAVSEAVSDMLTAITRTFLRNNSNGSEEKIEQYLLFLGKVGTSLPDSEEAIQKAKRILAIMRLMRGDDT